MFVLARIAAMLMFMAVLMLMRMTVLDVVAMLVLVVMLMRVFVLVFHTLPLSVNRIAQR